MPHVLKGLLRARHALNAALRHHLVERGHWVQVHRAGDLHHVIDVDELPCVPTDGGGAASRRRRHVFERIVKPDRRRVREPNLVARVNLEVGHEARHLLLPEGDVGDVRDVVFAYFLNLPRQHRSAKRGRSYIVLGALERHTALVNAVAVVVQLVNVLGPLQQAHLGRPDGSDELVVNALGFDEALQDAVAVFLFPVVQKVGQPIFVQKFYRRLRVDRC